MSDREDGKRCVAFELADGVMYEGDVKMGKLHGKGKLTTSNAQYEGDFANNVKHGWGVFTRTVLMNNRNHSNRQPSSTREPPLMLEYEGEWVDDQPTGRCRSAVFRQLSASQEHREYYTGGCRRGQPHGYGTYTYSDGSVYQGEFNAGVRHGRGRFTTSSNGDCYEGDFVEGRRTGNGKLIAGNASWEFVGSLVDGKKVRGRMVFSQCSAKDPYAIREYDGEWSNQKPNGIGALIKSNGDVYTGDVVNGRCEGSGIMKSHSSGLSYQGTFVNHVPDGSGDMHLPDGSKVPLEFDEGVLVPSSARRLQAALEKCGFHSPAPSPPQIKAATHAQPQQEQQAISHHVTRGVTAQAQFEEVEETMPVTMTTTWTRSEPVVHESGWILAEGAPSPAFSSQLKVPPVAAAAPAASPQSKVPAAAAAPAASPPQSTAAAAPAASPPQSKVPPTAAAPAASPPQSKVPPVAAAAPAASPQSKVPAAAAAPAASPPQSKVPATSAAPALSASTSDPFAIQNISSGDTRCPTPDKLTHKAFPSTTPLSLAVLSSLPVISNSSFTPPNRSVYAPDDTTPGLNQKVVNDVDTRLRSATNRMEAEWGMGEEKWATVEEEEETSDTEETGTTSKKGNTHRARAITTVKGREDGFYRDFKFAGGGTSTFTGTLVQCKRHGRGRYESDAYTYEGHFQEDKKHGYGVYTLKATTGATSGPPQVVSYEGEWLGDMKHTTTVGGLSRVVFSNKDVYIGTWKDNLMEGAGRYSYADGKSYRGEFCKGLRHGTGQMTQTNGDVYEGSFIEGKMSGMARAVTSSGTREFTGTFADGKKVRGRMVFFDPADRKTVTKIYDGEWCDEKPHGRGIMRLTNGDVYRGAFIQGRFCGDGVMYYVKDNKSYVGSFLDDKCHGRGMLRIHGAPQDDVDAEWNAGKRVASAASSVMREV